MITSPLLRGATGSEKPIIHTAMRSIYAALAVLLLIVTTATAGFAQSKSKPKAKPKEVITRTIIGCTLGESTFDQIKEKIQEQNGKIDTIAGGVEGSRVQVILASDIPFFGKTRNSVMLKTVDGVLYEVSFQIHDKDEANRLKLSLPEKYNNWQEGDFTASIPYVGGYTDSKTAVILAYHNDSEHGGGFEFAQLIYSDRSLFKKAEEIERADL